VAVHRSLTAAGAQDVFSQQLDLSITAVVLSLRVILVALPLAVAVFTYKVCKDLAGAEHLAEEKHEALEPFERAAAR
jgi:ACR3 family arsenite efflux pump ArsB